MFIIHLAQNAEILGHLSHGGPTNSCDDCPWEKERTGQIPLADMGEVTGGVYACTNGPHHFLEWQVTVNIHTGPTGDQLGPDEAWFADGTRLGSLAVMEVLQCAKRAVSASAAGSEQKRYSNWWCTITMVLLRTQSIEPLPAQQI